MEKRRSPRSSNSPGGSAIFPKSPLLYESYKSGCGWKLINLFGFRNVNKRLNSDKKPIRDSAGNVYTKSQLDLLKKLHEKCHCNDRIVEEEHSCKMKTKRRSLSSESKPVHGLLEREITRIKNLNEETFTSPDKRAEINLQVSVNEAAETLICSKAEEKGKEDRSKQFMEALDILSSNKELFITLLQDPNSFSTKKGQDFEGSKVKGDDEIVLLKPRLSSTSSVDDRVPLRFKHLAKKLKLVVGSGKARETEIGYRSPESAVFRRKKRVESDIFKLSIENDVLVSPRRFTVERQQQERLSSTPVYEVPNALSSSLEMKLKERRKKLEKRRESFKLWSLYNNFDVFDPNPTSLSSSLAETSSSPERRETNNVHEEEQPSPVSVLERIHLEDTKIHKIEEQIGLLTFDDTNIDLDKKDSVFDFVKKVLHASRLNWSNLMARCNEETSLLNEFSHGYDDYDNNHNKDQFLLVLDYTDEILREIYRQGVKFWPFTTLKSSRNEDLVQETMRRLDWSLLCCDSETSSRTLDEVIESDLVKPCLWLDSGRETEGVVSDVVDKILQQLLLEISYELRTMQSRILCVD